MIKLSKILQNAGNPKAFFLNHEESGNKVIYVNSQWLAENFAGSVFFNEEVDNIWGYFAPNNIGDFIENDTHTTGNKYKGRSADNEKYLNEMLAALEEYKLRQSLKITVLIP
jgi:hypothetical protein